MYTKTNEIPKAIENYEKALQATEDSSFTNIKLKAMILHNLAEEYIKNKETFLAMKTYLRAAELAKDNRFTDASLKLIIEKNHIRGCNELKKLIDVFLQEIIL